jgi:hypothetical protein
VDYCYGCLPGGPFTPPPCLRCASTEDYYSAGLCGRCHNNAPQPVGSCRDCQAWGVIRKHKWLCWGCRSWRHRFTRGTCRLCASADVAVDNDLLCRLCWRHAASADTTGRHPFVEIANAAGQQLFLANVPFPPQRRAAPRPHRARHRTATPASYPVDYEQLVMFPAAPRDLRRAQSRGTLPEPADAQFARLLDTAVKDHAARHGWPPSSIKRTRLAMRVLTGLQDTPGATLLASEAMQLVQLGLPARTVIEVASAAGLLLDDRQPAIRAWFTTTTTGLPAPMTEELREWFTVMLDGASTPPRRKPRSQITIRLHLSWAMPALRDWAAQGHRTLREITSADIRAILPSAGNPRSTMGAGLRSVFTVLKQRKVIFTNPTARIHSGSHERRQPLPVSTTVIRDALNSQNQARAALAGLTAFHALRAGDLKDLQLTDIIDGKLRIGERIIPLADPVRARIAAWLTFRNQSWPNSANTHLFINHWSAGRTETVGSRWLGLTLGIPVQTLREDRILHEIHASGGDVRRICDLFGVTVGTALRYLPNDDDESQVEH